MITITTETVNNEEMLEIPFSEAINHYIKGQTVECRIYNIFGEIVDWEKYNKCEGLAICVEFNEIINGKWFLHLNQ